MGLSPDLLYSVAVTTGKQLEAVLDCVDSAAQTNCIRGVYVDSAGCRRREDTGIDVRAAVVRCVRSDEGGRADPAG